MNGPRDYFGKTGKEIIEEVNERPASEIAEQLLDRDYFNIFEDDILEEDLESEDI